MPASGLGIPPNADTLRSIPAADPVSELHRLSEHPEPWWYASRPLDDPDGGRFDLPAPDGTCYLGETLDGALVEMLLRTSPKIVVRERLSELFHTTATVTNADDAADLTNTTGTGIGLNAEIHFTLDYTATRRWAAAIRKARWKALRYLLRGDPSASQAGRALFGKAGLHKRAPIGMKTSTETLDTTEAERLLARRNVEVLPIPLTVPICPPEVLDPP